ncbi:MAG: PLD nuclease N-terminal domain-containing protein [Gemmatimonadaceae bacterium]
MTQVPPGQSLLAGSRSWPIWLASGTIILLVGALLSVWLGKQHSVKAKAIWTAIIFAVPVLGPLSWFLLGRERQR